MVPLGFGMGMIPHWVPFQCSTSAFWTDGSVKRLPSAKQLPVLGHEIERSWLYVASLGFGLGMIDQLRPSQCNTSVFSPTAK